MKRIIFLLLSLFSLHIGAQQTEVSGKYDNIGKFYNGIAFVRLNGKVGAINSNGKEVIKPEWDKLSGFGSDGIGFAHKDGLVGLITKDGKLILKPIYERISNFKYGRATITKNNLVGIVDINGKVLIEPKYQKLRIDKGGLIRATENGTEVLLKTSK
ncbi:MAG: WG repeat-containing protein [Bacteroidetes bacterium]|nr:WG repeat-containing protein [Bacteroidota bacterium]